MTLLGNQGVGLAMAAVPCLVLLQVLLIVLEAAVALIQAYVFTTLATLYAREVN
jgi:F0F1-type ATP synthase membrane subunit a